MLLAMTSLSVLVEVETHNLAIDVTISLVAGVGLAILAHLVMPQRFDFYMKASALPRRTNLTLRQESGGLVKTLASVGPILGVLAVILYAMIYSGYAQFYDHFGISPQDVGVTYATAFLSTAGFFFAAGAIAAPVGIAYFAATRVGWTQKLKKFKGAYSGSRFYGNLVRESLVLTFLAAGCIVIVVYFGTLLPSLRRIGTVAASISFVNVSAQIGPFPVLGLDTYRASIEPVDNAQSTATWDLPLAARPNQASNVICPVLSRSQLYGATLIYLGKANGLMVFHYPACGLTVSIPVNSVVLIIYPHYPK
jgi:hypothetical protein